MKRSLFDILVFSIVTAPFLVLFSTSSGAINMPNFKVAEMYIDKTIGNVAFVRLNTATLNFGCSTNSTWHYTIDLNTSVGKSMYSALLAAAASGATVKMYGTNTCVEYGNVETLSGFSFVTQ